jgi:chemotaxis protein CheX
MTATHDETHITAEDFAHLAADVWLSYLGAAIEVRPAVTIPEHSAETLVSAYVLVSGAWQGAVALVCTPDVAGRLAAAMLGLDEAPDTEDVADAVGELANVFGGNVKSLVPQPSSISLPVVTWSHQSQAPRRAHMICGLDLDWDGHAVSLRIWAGDVEEKGGA